MNPTALARRFRIGLALAAAAVFCFAASNQAFAATSSPIRHVFVIMLENEGYDYTFGAHSPATYLSKILVKRGMLLTHYYGIGHYSLDNYIALISGQAPNYKTQGDCQIFADFQGSVRADGQAVGHGCVYPASVMTLANQLEHAGLTWKSYSEDMGNDPARESLTCGHPAINEADRTQKAERADQYAARHNPFVYFHAIIDTPACAADVVNFSSLQSDLGATATTANFNFITPNLCNDGHDGGRPDRVCANGDPGGLVSADAFLKKWVPVIMQSPAFKADGLIVITFDEADIDGRFDAATNSYTLESGDVSACCNEPAGPNIAADQTVFRAPDKGPGVFGPGGGRIGAVLLSPSIKPGSRSDAAYNHFSLLRTVEKLLGLPHLGYAAMPGLKTIDWSHKAR